MKPHLTEKSYLLATAEKPVYTFMVAKNDTTTKVKAFIATNYEKEVVDVRFVTNAAKSVRRRGVKGTVAARRKALVTLKKGQTIAAFDIPSADEPKDKKKKS